MLERLIYFFRRALRNMRQCPLLCAVAIATASVALTLMAFFVIVVLNVQQLTAYWSKDVAIVAYLDTDPGTRGRNELMEDIRSLSQVKGVRFVSKTEALVRFKKRMAQNAELLEGVGSDILPSSFEISLHPPYQNQAGIDGVISRLQGDLGLKDLRFGGEWVKKFDSFVLLLRLIGAVLGGFLVFSALLIISNTIRLTLYARRDELEIMSLVGATSMFIKTPFLIEGAIQGALGGLIALGGSYLVFQVVLRDGLSALLLASGGGSIIFLPVSYQLFLVSAGTFLGVFGSLISLRKFVRI